MILSGEKISHIAHLIVHELEREVSVEKRGDCVQLLKSVKRTLLSEFKQDDEIDAIVRRGLASYTRKIVEGGTEWDILYHKMFQEEMAKRRR